MRRMLATLLAVVGVWAGGCGSALGARCETDGDCGAELLCSRPEVDGEPASAGVCDYALRGMDEPCTVAAECAKELTCSSHFTPGGRYGTCVPQRAEGEACFADRDCTSGECQGASGGALDGLCAPEEAT